MFNDGNSQMHKALRQRVWCQIVGYQKHPLRLEQALPFLKQAGYCGKRVFVQGKRKADCIKRALQKLSAGGILAEIGNGLGALGPGNFQHGRGTIYPSRLQTMAVKDNALPPCPAAHIQDMGQVIMQAIQGRFPAYPGHNRLQQRIIDPGYPGIGVFAGAHLPRLDKWTQSVQAVKEIMLGSIQNGGQALFRCSLDIALTVIHKQGLVCSSFDRLQNIGEQAGITLAFAQVEAVEDPVKMTKKAVSFFQSIQPGDLVAEDGAFAALFAYVVNNFQHPGPDNKAVQDCFPAGGIIGLQACFFL